MEKKLCSIALRKENVTIHIRQITALLLTLLALVLSDRALSDAEITQKAQLNKKGMKVGVVLGSGAVLMIEQELPNAQMVYLNAAERYEMVAQGKTDAYIYDRRQMELAIRNGRRGIHLLDVDMDGAVQVAAGISLVSGIPDLE